MVGFCEHSDEPADSITRGNFLNTWITINCSWN